MARWAAAVGIVVVSIAAPAAGAATWRDLPVPQTVKANRVFPSPTVPGLAWMPIENQELLVTRDGGQSWAHDPPSTARRPSRMRFRRACGGPAGRCSSAPMTAG